VIIRPAVPAERKTLEALQWRASIANEGDRDALLRHPDAIDLPLEQITAGGVFVLERDGAIVGFSAILPRDDGDTELDALFVEPGTQRQGIGRKLIEHCAETARSKGASALRGGKFSCQAVLSGLRFQHRRHVRNSFRLGLADAQAAVRLS